MENVPSQLYVKESSKSNEETKKDLELDTPSGFVLGELLKDDNKISLAKETQDGKKD
jgi:hypothetical protein